MASSDDSIMSSSDDEGDTFPDSVSEFSFQDKDEKPISFTKLPVQWNESESPNANTDLVVLNGKVDKYVGTFYQVVKAWKFDISTITPEISVLSINNHWIKLEKPKRGYEYFIRSILISVHCLSFFKSKPEASTASLLDHLSEVFSSYCIRPSKFDLMGQTDFLREAVKRDETLSKSKFLVTFLENRRKRWFLDEGIGAANQSEYIMSDGDDNPFDSACAVCDNGGALICCKGKCFRSFHLSKYSKKAQESKCESLSVTPREMKRPFECENCRFNLHQCFVCNKLGSSDKSKNPEVFRCGSCRHFYHSQCVSKLLHKNDNEQQNLKEKIDAGEAFICPAHKCVVCNQTENEKVDDLQFAVCRRCPKSYHRKCLPRDIMFEHEVGVNYGGIRAWDGLLTKKRALIYCKDHEIDPNLGTPARTIKFRNILNIKTEQDAITSP